MDSLGRVDLPVVRIDDGDFSGIGQKRTNSHTFLVSRLDEVGAENLEGIGMGGMDDSLYLFFRHHIGEPFFNSFSLKIIIPFPFLPQPKRGGDESGPHRRRRPLLGRPQITIPNTWSPEHF